MNKNELISNMASASGLTKACSQKALKAFVSSVSSALKSGKSVRLSGFGTFVAAPRATTSVISPNTGKKVKIPAHKVAKFRAAKTLQDSLNKK